MIENKEIFSKNLNSIMKKKGVNAAKVCNELGFKPNTYSDWMNAKSYPRINKLQMLADYFGVSKAALVEDPENIILSAKEQMLIIGYRDSDETTRNIVDKILLKNA